MVIQCPSCKRQYNVEAERITESGVKITCPSCKHQFIARRGKQPEEKPVKKPEKKGPKTPPCAVCGQPSTHVLRGPPPKPLCEHHYQTEKEKESRFWATDEGAAPPEVDKDPGSSAWSEPGETHANISAAGRTQPGPPPQTAVPAAKAGRPIVRPPDADPAFETFDDDFDFFEEGPGGAGARKAAPTGGATKPAPPKPAPPPADDMNFDFDEVEFPRPGEKTVPPRPPAARPSPAPAPAPQPAPPASPKPAAAAGAPASPADDFGFDGLEFGPPAAGEENAFQPPPAKTVAPSKPLAPPPKSGPRPEAPLDADPFAAGASGLGPETVSEQAGKDDFASTFKGGATNLDGTPIEERSDQDEGEASFEWNVGGASSEPSVEDQDVGLKLAREIAPPPAPAKKPEFEFKRPKPAKTRGPAAAITIIAGLFVAMLVSAFLSARGWPAPKEQPRELWPPPAAWQGRLEVVPSDIPERINLSVPEFAQANGEERARDQAEAEDHARRARLLMYQDTSASYEAALREIQAAVTVDPKDLDYPALKISIIAFRESMDDKGETMIRGVETEQAWNSLRPALQSDPALARAKAHLLLNTNKNIAAQTILEEYIAKNTSDPIAYFILGQTYRYQNPPDLAKALMYLETAIRLDPGFIRADWEAARVDRDLNRSADAIAKYKEILKRSPDRKGVAEAMELSTGKTGPKPEVPPSTTPGKPPEPGTGKAPGTGTTPPVAVPKPEAPKGRGAVATGSQASDDIVESINDANRLFLKYNTGRNAPEPPPKTRPPEEGPPAPPEEGPK
jgi:predicted Zn finger-like uncharacterized protein